MVLGSVICCVMIEITIPGIQQHLLFDLAGTKMISGIRQKRAGL